MTIFWLSIALWFLLGIQSFVLFVREKTVTTTDDDTPDVRYENGQWRVYWDRGWRNLGSVFVVHFVTGPSWLLCRAVRSLKGRNFNLGLRFVAKDIIPLEIARKLEGEEKQQPAQVATTAPASLAAQQLPLSGLLQQAGLAGQMLQQGSPQQQGFNAAPQLGQPPSQP